jgi:hypothetical protein
MAMTAQELSDKLHHAMTHEGMSPDTPVEIITFHTGEDLDLNGAEYNTDEEPVFLLEH